MLADPENNMYQLIMSVFHDIDREVLKATLENFFFNANGDVDPCVFIHYSDSNIREKTLLECLQSPVFKAYHDGQPFHENHLRPCPMLENPQLLRKIVHGTNAKSTDLQSPESVDHLCDKCVDYAKHWELTAERLWADRQK